MKWFCFMFWFIWRLTLACLAHFNWAVSIYTNCVYFTLWKSYDLLWFWMHITLCTCFPQLRKENYLIVWTNLIRHRLSKYPNHTFKEIYLIMYGGKGTKAERALERMETIERRERAERLTRRDTRKAMRRSGEQVSSSSDDDESCDQQSIQPLPPKEKGVPRAIYEDLREEEEEKERCKYLYVGQAMESGADLPDLEDGKEEEKEEESGEAGGSQSPADGQFSTHLQPQGDGDRSGEDSDSSTSRWLQNVPEVISSKVKNRRDMRDIPVPVESETASLSKWARFKSWVPNPLHRLNRSVSSDVAANALDIIAPNYRNTYDVGDAKEEKRRAARDKKALTKKVRLRIKQELRVTAELEKRRKKVTDAIELLLQLLRMMTSFAVLVGNIRKTFIPAQFKYLRPGQHAYDNPELLFFFRCTAFLDVSMFMLNCLWAWCLQWHLCCRLGFFRFFFWSSLLSVVAFFVMLLPMSIAMDQLDLSWCHFAPNTTLYPYQPKW